MFGDGVHNLTEKVAINLKTAFHASKDMKVVSFTPQYPLTGELLLKDDILSLRQSSRNSANESS